MPGLPAARGEHLPDALALRVVRIRRYLGNVGHLQVAGVPERHEPDVGEVHYPYLFRLLDELGYEGWIGCEYRPKAGTTEGLAWAREWLEPRASLRPRN